MGEVLLQTDLKPKYRFRVDYPYYGLFGSADITAMREEEDTVFQCRLLNGSFIYLKKLTSKSWIDTSLNSSTPLALILGSYIDDFLKKL